MSWFDLFIITGTIYFSMEILSILQNFYYDFRVWWGNRKEK